MPGWEYRLKCGVCGGYIGVTTHDPEIYPNPPNAQSCNDCEEWVERECHRMLHDYSRFPGETSKDRFNLWGSHVFKNARLAGESD
jgi:hypothetical protein